MAEAHEHRVIHAAGAVIWRPGTAGADVALVHRPRYDDWSHPKGKRKRGEHLLLTAIREVREETGLGIVLGRPLSDSVYEVPGGTKHVSFWAASVEESPGFAPNDEVDEVAWLPVAAARERLTYERDIALLDELLERPVRTAPMIVLRHAEAGSKRMSAGDEMAAEDLARPLDARGVEEAEALAGLLASYGRCQVISSAAERCLATVRPYAHAIGTQVHAEPAFTIVPGPMSPAELLAVVADRNAQGAQSGRAADVQPRAVTSADDTAKLAAELAVSGVPTLVCAHRENLPPILDAAAMALGSRPPLGEPLRKSEFWILHSAEARLVAAERHGVPA
ncbi:MAG: NUDIX domain-containing protein [Streptosporangiaceae bacterium]